jgi:RNA polymerase sigma-70 factor (ECF subfamily)
MKWQDEIELINGFNRREEDAFTEVYYRCYPFVFSLVKKLTEGSPDAKDLVADVFERLLRYGGRFETLARVKLFLYVTARNVCYDHRRHTKVLKKRALEIKAFLKGSCDSIERALELSTVRVLIFEEMQHLPKQCRQVFELFYIEGLRNAEIAQCLSISEKTVSNQKAIALARLKMSILKANRAVDVVGGVR